jgi:hypothetical protein
MARRRAEAPSRYESRVGPDPIAILGNEKARGPRTVSELLAESLPPRALGPAVARAGRPIHRIGPPRRRGMSGPHETATTNAIATLP